MKAVANYDLTINGVIYKKGEQYDIDTKINGKNPFGGKYFTEVEETKVEPKETKKSKQTEAKSEDEAEAK